jgi:hypothetical protein
MLNMYLRGDGVGGRVPVGDEPLLAQEAAALPAVEGAVGEDIAAC